MKPAKGLKGVIQALASSLFGAGAFILAFPTVGWAVPILVAWVPLLILAPHWGWKRRLWAGWLMGFAYQLVLFRWIGFTLEQMTPLPAWAQVLATVGYAGWHGLVGGIFLALSEPVRRTWTRRWASSGPLGVAVLYVALEWAWPALFPWGIGHAFWEVSALVSIVALTGVPGLSLIVILVNAAAAELIQTKRMRSLAWTLVVLVPMLGFGGAWSLYVNNAQARNTWRVAVIQPNFPLAEKKRAGRAIRWRFLKKVNGIIRDLPANKFDFVVLPEGAYPFYWHLKKTDKGYKSPRSSTHPIALLQAAIATGPGVPTLVGGIQYVKGQRSRNTAVLFDGQGRMVTHYDKRVLVPFGEYIPGRDLFPSIEKSVKGIGSLDAGSEPCLFEVNKEQVTCGICYETMFADGTREAASDASLLVNITIDTWFGETTAPRFHLMVHASRAAELGIPLIRSALTGISAIIGADGVPVKRLSLGEEGVIDAEISFKSISTPYRFLGPLFRWVVVFIACLSVVLAWRRARRLKEEESNKDGGYG